MRNTFYTKFKSFYYYHHEQPKFSSIERNFNNFFTKFSRFDFISQLETVCLFLKIPVKKFSMKKFSKLASAGRHRKISVVYVKHKILQQSKWARAIGLNTTHIILFKSSRDIQQLTYIGKQLSNTSCFKRKL